jgi:hypothetical protein
MANKKARFILKWKIHNKSKYFNSLGFNTYDDAAAHAIRVFNSLNINYTIEGF